MDMEMCWSLLETNAIWISYETVLLGRTCFANERVGYVIDIS